eukprot:gene18099-biopygen38535
MRRLSQFNNLQCSQAILGTPPPDKRTILPPAAVPLNGQGRFEAMIQPVALRLPIGSSSMRRLLQLGPWTLVVSDGNECRPHCSWNGGCGSCGCTWNAPTKSECATMLCQRAGYPSGVFVSASNDACSASFTNAANYFKHAPKALTSILCKGGVREGACACACAGFY